jgi:hypothetical protein
MGLWGMIILMIFALSHLKARSPYAPHGNHKFTLDTNEKHK